MKKVILEEKNFSIPTSWYDINLNQYQKLKEIEPLIDELEDYSEQFLSILLNKDKQEIVELNLENFTYLYELMYDFTKSPIPRPESNFIKVNEKKFIFDKDIKGISIGLFSDLNNKTKDTEIINVAHKVSAIFIRPAIEKGFASKLKNKLNIELKETDYLIDKYNFNDASEREEFFLNNLPIPYIIESTGFFLHYQNRLKKTSQ